MKKTLTILLILITAISYTVSAESISNLNRKKMILAVMDAVDRYESYSGLYSYETKADFVDLFIDPEQKSIFCDVYPSASFLDMVSADEYSSLFFNDAKEYIYTSFAIELKNVRVRDIYYRDGRWFAKVSLLKSVSCSDKNYVYFPIGSQNVRSEDFQLEMIMQLDESALTPSFKISQISCTNKGKYAKSNDIYIIHKPKDKIVSKRQSKLRIGGKALSYNEFDYSSMKKGSLTYPDDDIIPYVVYKDRQPSYDYVSVGYKTLHFRTRLRNEISPMAYSCRGNLKPDKRPSWAYTIGLDLGYSFGVTEKFKLGIYTGVGWSYSSVNLKLTDMAPYSYKLTTPEGKHYTRKYTFYEISQRTSTASIMVPAYLNAEYKLDKKLTLLVDLGVKSYFNRSTSVLPVNVQGNVSGMYKDGQSINNGVFATGKIDKQYSEFINESVFYREPNDICVMGGVGVNYTLIDKLLSAHCIVSYEYGIGYSYKSPVSSPISIADQMYPLAYSGSIGADVMLMPLLDCVSLRRSALSFNLGLTIKF